MPSTSRLTGARKRASPCLSNLRLLRKSRRTPESPFEILTLFVGAEVTRAQILGTFTVNPYTVGFLTSSSTVSNTPEGRIEWGNPGEIVEMAEFTVLPRSVAKSNVPSGPSRRSPACSDRHSRKSIGHGHR